MRDVLSVFVNLIDLGPIYTFQSDKLFLNSSEVVQTGLRYATRTS